MWKGVTQRFQQFDTALHLTDAQNTDGATKHLGVRQCLNKHYFRSESETDNSFLIGSWGKHTRVRPPRDVDIYFVLPDAVYHRYQSVQGNRQSILLQEVKGVLQKTYPSTDMRGDGQVVVVDFQTFKVEVAPVFRLTSGQYYFCNTKGGGSYQVSDPFAEVAALEAVDSAHDRNARTIIRMMKAWQGYCNAPIKSVQLELLVSDFIRQSPWGSKSWFYYDWLIRDCFGYIWGRANTNAFMPGTGKAIYLGDAWRSRCETAYTNAVKACDDEYNDWVYSAGENWRKIFGTQIPQGV